MGGTIPVFGPANCDEPLFRKVVVRYLAVVTDYDGVIANDGRPSEAAIVAIGRLRASGQRAVLITGRRLEDLLTVFPQLDLFDCVVAENGAVFYEPATHRETSLAKPAPQQFIERLKALHVEPLEAVSSFAALFGVLWHGIHLFRRFTAVHTSSAAASPMLTA